MEAAWNERYAQEKYIYGKLPNEYFKSIIDTLSPGKILIPGAGEGRDAIYAANKGWEVFAVDMSSEAKKKALKLAEETQVKINYTTSNIDDFIFEENSFDAIASIYFHLPENLRKKFHHNCIKALKTNGIFIEEAFTPAQLNFQSGGPKIVEMLYTKSIMHDDLKGLTFIENVEMETNLDEGDLHKGKAQIIRVKAIKK